MESNWIHHVSTHADRKLWGVKHELFLFKRRFFSCFNGKRGFNKKGLFTVSMSPSGLTLLVHLNFSALMISLYNSGEPQNNKYLKMHKKSSLVMQLWPLPLLLFSVPFAVSDFAWAAHGSGAGQGFHARKPKGQILIKHVVVSGL